MAKNPAVLTMSQYAIKYGVSRQQIHNYLLQGRIPGAIKTQVLGGPKDGIWIIPYRAKIQPLTSIK